MEYNDSKTKGNKKDLEKEIEEIESETKFTDIMARANEMIFMLEARATEAANANNQSPQTGSARTARDQSNDETFNPDDALWLSEDHSDTSRAAIEEEFICRTLKPSQMKLPRFWGDEEEFPGFWAVYETLVHQNKVLSTVEKMILLKDSLRGRAEMTIKGIQLIPQNYKWMVETIKKKYGNKPINRAKIVQKLIDLPCERNNVENCTYIFDKIRMLINQMVSAGQDISNTQDAMWTERILEKFPYNIVKNVLISIQEKEDVKVENVMEQLEKEINAKKNSLNQD
ncbi:hypothetical protein RB195_018903 [Necator americanus]|uniref:Uncharacterized protein n=1 Tax=Necator americanus TaxID=51031 RepID=A0ABR1CBQ8_NECAM